LRGRRVRPGLRQRHRCVPFGVGLAGIARKSNCCGSLIPENTALYPASGSTDDRLAETFMRLGREELGRPLRATVLEIQPDDPNAKAVRYIRAAAPRPSSTAN
jgi:hypothetical protein